MFNFFSKSYSLSIDLGTANTLIYMSGKIVLDEPSVVSVKNNGSRDDLVIAVGNDAKNMLGRTPGEISAIRPMKDGVIADFKITEKMLQHFIRKVIKGPFFRPSPRVLVCVPSGATQVERRAIKESVLGAGAKEVFLIEESKAAAVGAGMPISEATGSMIIDIGGGTTEIAVISLNGIVYSESIRVGGDRFDEVITQYIRKEYGVIIGLSTAEHIKKKIGCAYKMDKPDVLEVVGRDTLEGIPKKFKVRSNEILKALEEPLSLIVRSTRIALEQTPPELGADIAQNGLVLTGGGALLTGIDILLEKETSLPVRIAEDPLTCVARGGGVALKMLDKNRSFFATE